MLYGGDALARRGDGKAVFIPYAVPGDRLLVRPRSEKKNYIRAEIIEILTPGDGRVTPVCTHFGKCGGCCWQQVEYSRQVEAKRLIFEELFRHHFPETAQLAIVMRPCPKPFGYRSRARLRRQLVSSRSEFQISESDSSNYEVVVGFFQSGSYFVEDIESCPLFRPCLNDALSALRGLPFSPVPNDEINIACSEEDGRWAIANDDDREAQARLLRRKVGEFTYNVTAGTFFQANDFMIDELVSHVIGCVSPDPADTALDLFSGAGLFSLPLARHFRAVTAVEYSRESHRLCVMNAAEAGINNLKNIRADAAEWLDLHAASRFDCVVLDPPRAGVGPGIMENVGRLASQEIVYVSCDPQTLVRDLERLDMNCWRIVSIEGFDMFPQTYHFETVVHLQRKSL